MPATPLFEDGWPLWCLLAACGSIAQVAEARTRWGAALSGPLASMIAALGLAAAGIIPVDCTAYDTVWRYAMPLAAACFLLETDVARLATDGGPVLAAFVLGGVGMVIGAVAGWWMLQVPLGPTGAKLAACLCASYVGGSVNFAAVAQALHVPPSVLPAAVAADNLMMAVFLAALMAVPVKRTATGSAAAAAGTSAAAPVKPAGSTLHDANAGSDVVLEAWSASAEWEAHIATHVSTWPSPSSLPLSLQQVAPAGEAGPTEQQWPTGQRLGAFAVAGHAYTSPSRGVAVAAVADRMESTAERAECKTPSSMTSSSSSSSSLSSWVLPTIGRNGGTWRGESHSVLPEAQSVARLPEPPLSGPLLPSSLPTTQTAPPPTVTAESLSLTLAAAATACTVSQHLATAINVRHLMLPIMAVIAAGIVPAAGTIRSWATGQKGNGPVFAGASQLGTTLMMLYFAVIGASAGSLADLATCGVLLPYMIIMVVVHWAVMLVLGRGLLRLPVEALLLGSNANIGGSATAAAMAAAKGWHPLVQPAMMAGSLGYAAGTAAGLAVAKLIGAAAGAS